MRIVHRWTAWFMILLFAAAALPVSRVSTLAAKPANPRKVSPDLLQRVGRGEATNRARLIIQFNPTSTQQIKELLLNYGANVTRRFNALNMRVVDLPLRAVEALASQKEVRFISPDRQIGAFGHIETTTGTSAVRTQTTTSLGGLIATTTTFDGSGIGIAIIDSGIDTQHVSLKNQWGFSRVIVSQDFTGENRTDDLYGHGTHVASIAAGNNQISSGDYTGIAPGANLINLRILDAQGAGTTSNLLAALDWVLMYHTINGIQVVNMSIGTPAVDSYWNDPLCQAVRRVTDAGVIVVAAAGNNGKSSTGEKVYGQIHSPGNEPSVITVGAANSFGSDARDDDGVTTYSSRGPTRSFWTDANGAKHYDNLFKPDLVAPGNKIVGAAAANNLLLATHPELDANVSSIPARRMMYLSGSSMATPVAAGTVALLLQANPNLTPSLVKAILMYTAQPLAGWNMLEQGAGEINVAGALQLAQSVRSDLTNSTPLGDALLRGDAPPQQTTISQQTFSWSGGIILNHAYTTAADLITKYQKIYGSGLVLGDGVVEGPSSQSINADRMTSTILLGASVLTSAGTTLGDGTIFLDSNLLLGNGLLLPDGVMVGDGVMVSDGVIVGDGVMVGDTSPASINGDGTVCMR